MAEKDPGNDGPSLELPSFGFRRKRKPVAEQAEPEPEPEPVEPEPVAVEPEPPPDEPGSSWLHVSAGLGTSPYAQVRLSCRPEATLLTLVARG